MAHFAELDSNNVVQKVIVVANQDILDADGNESESVGVAYLRGLFGENTNWAQTSYNGNMRARYAGRGLVYDADVDAFLYPKPFPSWTLNQTTFEWEAPTAQPELTDEMISSGQTWVWEESSTSWVVSD